MENLNYTGNVTKLLEIGKVNYTYEYEKWLDYPKDYGLTSDDIPELIRLTANQELFFNQPEDTEPEISAWGPLHALMALGELKATEAIKPLIEVYKWEDDYTLEILPPVFGLIGPDSLPALKHVLDTWFHKKYEPIGGAFVEAFECIAEINPESREDVGNILVEKLRNLNKNDKTLNGFLINSLTKLKIEKALPVIEQAFKKKLVDSSIIRWHTVQHDFGLIDKAEFDQTEKEFRAEMLGKLGLLGNPKESTTAEPDDEPEDFDPYRGNNQIASVKKQKDKAKAKRKMAKASQKKNRKK